MVRVIWDERSTSRLVERGDEVVILSRGPSRSGEGWRSVPLGRGYRRRIGLPAPAIVARLGAPLLGSSGSLALTGRRVVATRLLAEGFEFHQTEFEATARDALQRCGLL